MCVNLLVLVCEVDVAQLPAGPEVLDWPVPQGVADPRVKAELLVGEDSLHEERPLYGDGCLVCSDTKPM